MQRSHSARDFSMTAWQKRSAFHFTLEILILICTRCVASVFHSCSGAVSILVIVCVYIGCVRGVSLVPHSSRDPEPCVGKMQNFYFCQMLDAQRNNSAQKRLRMTRSWARKHNKASGLFKKQKIQFGWLIVSLLRCQQQLSDIKSHQKHV